MRFARPLMSGALALLCFQVLAAEPPATPAVSEAAVPAANAEPAAAPTAAEPAQAATPATPAAAAANSPEPVAESDDNREQAMRRQGYSVKQKDGEKYYCKKITPLGSRLGTKSVCMTYDQAMAMQDSAQQAMRERVRNNKN